MYFADRLGTPEGVVILPSKSTCGRASRQRRTNEDRTVAGFKCLVKLKDKRHIYENVVRPSRGDIMAIDGVWMVKKTG